MKKDEARATSADHALDEELTPQRPVEHLSFEALEDVRLPVSADLGKTVITVGEVLRLAKGSVLTLDKVAGEMADILVNDVPIARGEVVVVGDSLNVRIAEVIDAEQDVLGGE